MIELILKSYFSILFAVGASCLSLFFLGLYFIFKQFAKPEVAKAKKAKKPKLRAVNVEVKKVSANAATATTASTHTTVTSTTVADDSMPTDVNAFAGEDLFSTQLDLARAFMESGKERFAKKILESIVEDGDNHQQERAKMLLAQI